MRPTHSRQGHYCCSGKHEGKIATDKSEPLSTEIQCHSYVRAQAEKKVGRKGLIRARAALSPASLSISSSLTRDQEGKDGYIINALIMIIFYARLIHVKPTSCQIEN